MVSHFHGHTPILLLLISAVKPFIIKKITFSHAIYSSSDARFSSCPALDAFAAIFKRAAFLPQYFH